MPSALLPNTQQSLYILKVIAGLLTLALLVAAASWLPLSGWSSWQNCLALAALLLLSLMLIPVSVRLYRRSDELQRLQHQEASVQALSTLACLCTVLGILQASEVLPLFNQFWTLGLLVAVRGFQLMASDRRYR